jgi:hypothetical protein
MTHIEIWVLNMVGVGTNCFCMFIIGRKPVSFAKLVGRYLFKPIYIMEASLFVLFVVLRSLKSRCPHPPTALWSTVEKALDK